MVGLHELLKLATAAGAVTCCQTSLITGGVAFTCHLIQLWRTPSAPSVNHTHTQTLYQLCCFLNPSTSTADDVSQKLHTHETNNFSSTTTTTY